MKWDLAYPNAKKCWLLTKQGKEDAAREAFRDTAINISTQGQKHLGAVLGSRTYLEEYVNGKVEGWVDQVVKLAEFAATYPQASYAAFTFGLKHRWTYYLRTLPDIEDLLEPLERTISHALIPAITGHTCTPAERDLLALPVRMGGLGITNPCHFAASEYEASTAITEPLVEQIVAQTHELPDDHAIRTLQQCNRRDKDARLREDLEEVKNALPEQTKRAADLAAEKGASSWLTVIPVKDVDFTLNKREFKDAIHLRYDWQISDTPSTCACGDKLRKWWDVLNEMGPSLGYYPNAKKCWLLTKQGKEDAAREVFRDTAINISTQGQKHLGAVLGSRTYLEEYVNGKVEGWVDQVVKLAEFAATYPQASYAAFTFGRHSDDWQISDTPSTCACGDVFDVDHAMICRRGGFIIQRHKVWKNQFKVLFQRPSKLA